MDYLFGQDMVSVIISNNGNTTAIDFDLDLLVSDDGVNYISQSCYTLHHWHPINKEHVYLICQFMEIQLTYKLSYVHQ